MTAFELALKYYPHLWNDARLNQLISAGVLTQDEVNTIKGLPT